MCLAAPAAAAVGDCAIDAGAVGHDSFQASDRRPFGAVDLGSRVRLRLRAATDDLTGARVRLWDAARAAERFVEMQPGPDGWTAEVAVGDDPTLLYYQFELTDAGDGCAARAWYVDDEPVFRGGGSGRFTEAFEGGNTWQISVYDAAAFDVPAWLGAGPIYQVFPDRFRDGDPDRGPRAPRFYYGDPEGTVWRSGGEAWNTRLCDPQGTREPACPGVYSNNFYGGDLAGLIDRIEAGYFDALGVGVLYLNPIVWAPSNHKYDAIDLAVVDPELGDAADVARLVEVAAAHDLEIILDGVFNHVSSDSRYFDAFGRHPAVGACEDAASPFRDWFYFPALGNPAGGGAVRCAGDATYEAWFGYSALPKLRADHPAVRDLIIDGPEAVGPGWIARGFAGWRLDVGGDVDPGAAAAPGNDFWERFRAAVRDPARAGRADAIVLGEEWGDASSWLLGREWDSVMNYRFRSAALGWAARGCAGPGCEGDAFLTGDENRWTHSGPIAPLSPSDLHQRLMSLREDYPPPAWGAMMNLLGSHDTQRIRFLLEKVNPAPLRALRQLWVLQFTYAGAPTIYYGDEVGLSEPGAFSDGTWHDDPYNRAPYPWPDTPGDYGGDAELLAYARHLASLRWALADLRSGEVEHGVVIDDARGLYGYRRGALTVVLSRGERDAELTVDAPGEAAVEALTGAVLAVVGGRVRVTVPAGGAVVVVDPAAADVPVGPPVTVAGDVLRWLPVARDIRGGREVAVRYRVRDATGEVVGEVPPSWVGPTTVGPLAPGDYTVTALNALGVESGPADVRVEGEGDDAGVDAALADAGADAAADTAPEDARALAPDAAPPRDAQAPRRDGGRLRDGGSDFEVPRPSGGGCNQGGGGAPFGVLILLGLLRRRLSPAG